MSNTEVTHRIDVAASADAVYRIVADVSLWPLYFPPTVRAERVAGDDSDERIRIWAVANGDLRTWESRRRLDPAAHRVRFEQTRPAAPVAAMGGEWSVQERGDGTCTVVLDHHYRATGDDPAALARIAQAVETNSVSELSHLRRAAERGDAEKELLLDFSDTDVIAGSLGDTYDFIYDAAKWPDRIPHVVRMDLREDVSGLQYMEMDTRAPDGSVHTTVSGRVCTPQRRIVYKQTKLPPVLQAHNGEWLFEDAPDGTVKVTSRHQVILDPQAIAALPEPPASLEAARAAVRNSLGSNSRATLARARAFVEAR
ncbi:aromatase/cyclase [Streptomyces sp. ISL-1]|uniref:aromatase/cyclase n=1 Tax=Streptomyces sp. ISL-1 TaxID=2817657 RepID=UPI001BE4F068|nr:aromatase/cyclase [Streptomyces sp. ISL-1]MBT2388389.1 aromatase/cyclase [Streptomyces sp. ISL-1]